MPWPLPVPTPDVLRPPGAPGTADARAAAGPPRARPRPEEFPLLGLLRPLVTADVPVRAPGRGAPDAGPTIEVTIGRVDVRVDPPPASARRPPAPRPGVLPLAEYLVRRKGGR
ncbi:hypothetical protein SAMN06893096_102210 [Geodermatophilus pulveris]|uniref:Uncharacterized protein n=1 Tax=Geodermatophilus pulveris TaxID=1564159 RepID=A0A239C3B2_9ACTN|nr:hypothetical protein SAMN06893096_102210 [Geodermatophilus pulveris]